MRLIAIGTRMPGWVDAAFEDYTRRLRGPWQLKFTALAPERRGQGADEAAAARRAEGERILALLGSRDYVVALDERGAEPTTLELARWLEERRMGGQPVTFIIGGPDGLAAEVLERAQYRWALSKLTLPHGLVRVVLAEQLYRAATVLAGHPYHRT
jgi:23S rRNA (pseudouridine1915-N3)-methyltransferase